MNFSKVVDVIRSQQEANRPLRNMLKWLQEGKGFCHIRVNDGEALCLTGLRRPEDRNNCGHHYFNDLRLALCRMLVEIREHCSSNPNHRVLLGSYWYTQGSSISDLDEAARELVRHLEACSSDASSLLKYPWAGSDDIVRELTTDLPYQIFDYIRGSGRPAYLICNPRNEPGRHCLGAKCLPISRTDCWLDTKRVMETCSVLAKSQEPATFLWACGMAKPWIWKTYIDNPQTAHLDIGHLFDACFGEHSRAYTRRRDRSEPLWAAYEDRFIPYCKRFVP